VKDSLRVLPLESDFSTRKIGKTLLFTDFLGVKDFLPVVIDQLKVLTIEDTLARVDVIHKRVERLPREACNQCQKPIVVASRAVGVYSCRDCDSGVPWPL
jgi:hypothetical protein